MNRIEEDLNGLYKFAKLKMYLDRGQTIIYYLKNIAYVFITVSVMKLWSPLEQYATIPFFVFLTFLMFIIMLTFGYMDMQRVKFYQNEIIASTSVNPVMMQILEDLEELKRRSNEKDNDKRGIRKASKVV